MIIIENNRLIDIRNDRVLVLFWSLKLRARNQICSVRWFQKVSETGAELVDPQGQNVSSACDITARCV